jgi:hypothetical protein
VKRRGVLLEAALAALFGLGALHWLYVFGFLTPGFAGMSFTVADWPKEVRYYVALQHSLMEGRIPWYVSRSIQETRKFLANPEVPWSPDVLLLRFVGIEVFLALKVLLWYAVGFAGLLLVRRRYALSLPPFALLFLLFAMNGHIVAHLAIGHSMWTGYFLLPFVFLYLTDAVGGADAAAPPKLALVLFLMLLQGALHIFVACLLLVLLTVAFRRRAWKPLLVALLWTAALGACRLVPAAVVLFGKMEQVFISGYASAADLLAAFVSIRPITYPRQGGLFGTLNWWEFDVYLGAVGLAWVLWFGIVLRFKGPAGQRFAALDGPLAVMTLLSLGDLYAPINRLGIPLLGGERVSSRLLIVPIVFLLVIAAARTQRVLESSSRRRLASASAAAAAVLVAAGLALHSREWSLPVLERTWPPPPHARDLGIAVLEPRDVGPTARDAAYTGSVKAGAAVSLLALGALGFSLWPRRAPGAPAPASAERRIGRSDTRRSPGTGSRGPR